MASFTDNPELWRLSTPGGIKYKLVSQDGRFSYEHGVMTARVLIRTETLYAFLEELFPRPTIVGNMIRMNALSFPGFPSIVAKDARVVSQDGGKPIDLFGNDPLAPSRALGAPADTYHPLLQLDIDYDSSVRKKDVDLTDPRTFIEISGNTTGEFLTTPQPGAQWIEKVNPLYDAADTTGDWVDLGTGQPRSFAVSQNPIEENLAETFPMTVLVPHTEWTLRWADIPFIYFRDILVHRLDILMGRVNRLSVPVLFNAPAETLLFLGYTYNEQPTWREGLLTNPAVTVELKVLQKKIIQKGVIVGHNEFWRPGYGWQTLVKNDGSKTYKQFDFNIVGAVGSIPDDDNSDGEI